MKIKFSKWSIPTLSNLVSIKKTVLSQNKFTYCVDLIKRAKSLLFSSGVCSITSGVSNCVRIQLAAGGKDKMSWKNWVKNSPRRSIEVTHVPEQERSNNGSPVLKRKLLGKAKQWNKKYDANQFFPQNAQSGVLWV